MSALDKIDYLKQRLSDSQYSIIANRLKDFVKEKKISSVDIATSEDFNYVWNLIEQGYKAVRVGRFDLKGKKPKYIFVYGK
ncbi:MAG: hypothetical protein ACYDDE_00460 [bacterium]